MLVAKPSAHSLSVLGMLFYECWFSPQAQTLELPEALFPFSWRLYHRLVGQGTGSLQAYAMPLPASAGRLDQVKHGLPNGKGICGRLKPTDWTGAGMTSFPQGRFTDTWAQKVSSVSEVQLSLSVCHVASCSAHTGPVDLRAAAAKSPALQQAGVHGHPAQQDLTADM